MCIIYTKFTAKHCFFLLIILQTYKTLLFFNKSLIQFNIFSKINNLLPCFSILSINTTRYLPHTLIKAKIFEDKDPTNPLNIVYLVNVQKIPKINLILQHFILN